MPPSRDASQVRQPYDDMYSSADITTCISNDNSALRMKKINIFNEKITPSLLVLELDENASMETKQAKYSNHNLR